MNSGSNSVSFDAQLIDSLVPKFVRGPLPRFPSPRAKGCGNQSQKNRSHQLALIFTDEFLLQNIRSLNEFVLYLYDLNDMAKNYKEFNIPIVSKRH